MIHRKTHDQKLPSFLPKWSDPDIIKAVLNTEFWKSVFLGEPKTKWMALKVLLLLKLEMVVAPLRAVLHVKHGKRTTGIIITTLSALMMIAYNADHIAAYACTFMPFMLPALPWILPEENLYHLAFVDIHSVYLLRFWIAYLVLSTIHLSIIYLGKSGEQNSRGRSWIELLLPKMVRPPSYVIHQFIEPMIVAAVGYYLIIQDLDSTFGVFLMIGASALFVQEAYDSIIKFTMRSDPR